jgi:hypothetical protein
VGLSGSRTGATGLIRVPNAEVLADGDFRIGGEGHTANSKNVQGAGITTTAMTSIGILPHLEAGIDLGDNTQQRNKPINVKWQMLGEGRQTPAFAIGVADLDKYGGPYAAQYGYKDFFYASASKLFANGLVNATLGVRTTPGRPMAGAEVGLFRYTSAVAEYDGFDFNYGVRFGLLKDTIQVAAQHLDGGWSFEGLIRFKMRTGRQNIPQSHALPRPGAGLNDIDAARAIQTHLERLGLENVAVRIGSGPDAPLLVSYENRSYPHTELDALANVLAVASSFAPERVASLQVVVHRMAVPVLRVACSAEDYRQFMAGTLDDDTFRERLAIDHDTSNVVSNRGASYDTGNGSPSYGHTDLFIRPGVITQLGTENSVAAADLFVRPELDTPLLHGVNADIRASIPVGGPIKPVSTQLDGASLNIATSVNGNGYVGAAFGRFTDQRDGAYGEGVWISDRYPALLRLSGAVLKSTDGLSQKPSAVAEARYYFPWLDMDVRFTGGKYVDGDTGATLGLVRHFGNTDIGIDFRHTNFGDLGVFSIGIPLGPSHLGQRPSDFRLRPPDYFDFSQSGVVTGTDYLGLANRIGNQVTASDTVERRLMDRDRLNRQYILRSIGVLRRVQPLQ